MIGESLKEALYPKDPRFNPKNYARHPDNPSRAMTNGQATLQFFLGTAAFMCHQRFLGQQLRDLMAGTVLSITRGNIEVYVYPVIEESTAKPMKPEDRDNFVLGLPHNFIKQLDDDPIEIMCQVTSASSMVTDFNNGIDTEGRDPDSQRSLAAVAHFLRAVQEHEGPNLPLNETQRQVLKLYPQGLASLPRELRLPRFGPAWVVDRLRFHTPLKPPPQDYFNPKIKHDF
jgi:hypothetical protein